MNCYLMTAQAKIEGVKEFIATLLDSNVKFLLYAHHREIMDAY